MSVINQRLSSVTHSVAKYHSKVPNEEITDEDRALKASVLNMNGKCEYCEVEEAKTVDHYRKLVENKFPTKYCDDFWNQIPCCKKCNSSKGKQDYWVWINGTSISNPFREMTDIKKQCNINKFRKFEEIFEERHYEKTLPEELVKASLAKHEVALNTLQTESAQQRVLTTFRRRIDNGVLITSDNAEETINEAYLTDAFVSSSTDEEEVNSISIMELR